MLNTQSTYAVPQDISSHLADLIKLKGWNNRSARTTNRSAPELKPFPLPRLLYKIMQFILLHDTL